MEEQTAISWADATFNPWIGCTKVSPACDHCYAARDNDRRKWVSGWGAGVPRRRTKTWGDPKRWNRKAEATGYRPRVFCASLADVADKEVDPAWRVDLWQLLRETPYLRWMLVTKRIGNLEKMVPDDWPFPHVGVISTIVTQAEWDRDWPKLKRMPAPWRGISMEPLLGEINIGSERPEWIITGGESGPVCRITRPEWVASLRDQCSANGIAFHHKQWGGVRPEANGCLLDGVEYKQFPAALAA